MDVDFLSFEQKIVIFCISSTNIQHLLETKYSRRYKRYVLLYMLRPFDYSSDTTERF